MTYLIEGLSPDRFAPLFALDDAELAAINARRVTATADRGFPCRISLVDAKAGEELILLHHTSHDVATPYRSAYAIYVRSGVVAARYRGETPPVFEGRPLALHAFGADGMLQTARLAAPGEADGAIRSRMRAFPISMPIMPHMDVSPRGSKGKSHEPRPDDRRRALAGGAGPRQGV